MTDYTFSGTITSKTFYGTSPVQLPASVSVGATLSGIISIDDSVPRTAFTDYGSGGTYSLYGDAVTFFTTTVGTATYSQEALTTKYQGDSMATVAILENRTHYEPGQYLDMFDATVGSEDFSDPAFRRQTQMSLVLTKTGTYPQAITSSALAGLQVDLQKFTNTRQLKVFDYSYLPFGYEYEYMRAFEATITSWSARVHIDTLDSGTYAVRPGDQVIASSATGGAIDASAGSAEIGTLAGATLNTGAAGATVTTLTSGIINTAGGSITTQGGTFTGEITGNGGLNKTGTGTLILNSANSFTGNTVINAGTVEIAVGDALGTGAAPIRITNSGKLKALAGVAVTKPVLFTSTTAVYEHVLNASDSLTNLAPISNNITTADIVAGDAAATTFTSNFNGNGSISLHGLNGTKFLMVLDMEGYIPEDATLADTFLGWWDETANAGAGGWVNAVIGNIGTAGSLAGGYTTGYQQFLTANGGWNGTTMLGAYGLDLANQQVWAVIDHNSDFGVTNNGILVVPEPSSLALAGIGLAGGGMWLKRRRWRAARRGAA